MKNRKVFLALVICTLVLLLTGCGFYNLVKKDDFEKHFGALGYTILKDETPKYNSESYLVAEKEDVPFKIEHYEFTNEVEAKKVYEKMKANIKDYITTDSQNKETTGAVFSKTVAVSDNEYILISRVKNTIMFVATTKDYTKVVDDLFQELKY